MRYHLFVLFCLTAWSVSFAQSQVFTPEELKEDFEVFRGSIEEMHPGVYWYTSKQELDQAFDLVEQSLTSPLTEIEYFRLLAPIISKVRCGHTWIAPPRKLTREMREEGRLFPLDFKLIEGRAYCSLNRTDNQDIAPGNELFKINGYSIDSLVTIFQRNHSSDGYVNTWTNFIFERYFRYYYPYYIGQPDNFEVEYKNSTGLVKTSTVGALSVEELRQRRKVPLVRKDYIDLTFLEEDIALLDIREFNHWKSGKKRKNFGKVLDKSFSSIDSSGVDHLIIDLRGNTGGYEKYGLQLMSYFKGEPFTGYRQIRLKNKSFKYRKYSKTGPLLYLLFQAYLKLDHVNDTTYLLRNDRNLKQVEPPEVIFKGNIYVLTDGGSTSTTADFCSLMRYHQLATFVGEETGGGALGNTSNFSFEMKLPNTKIQYELPITQYLLNVEETKENFGRGTVPDHVVKRNMTDILNNTDTQLNFVLQLIHESN